VTPPELPAIMVEPIVRAALLEDLGRAGDITTDAIVPADAPPIAATLAARKPGRIAGLGVAIMAFRLLDPGVRVEIVRPDGSDVVRGDAIASIAGSMRGILSAERTALNLLSRLSGIATATQALVVAVRGTRATIACTRKLTPGLRALEKYAIRVGGGLNHRFGLDDAILIKDNHIAAVGGIRPALERARAAVGHLVKIEIEVDTLAQLREVLDVGGADAVLLDNMSPAQMQEAVAIAAGRVVLEASGSIAADTIAAVAATGVDVISSGWLTHSAPALDVGLDFAEEPLPLVHARG
jgi:nicotinate-nucleotide pyrophosphorylase (carboxylating)